MGRKIIVRIDDVGYTNINNIGAFEVFDKGIGTAADVMLDTPGTIDALERLKNYPWLSIGWHTHFWGSPILKNRNSALLIDEKTGHFRSDISRVKDESIKDALLDEMRAQIELCIRILGKAPDTTENMGPGDSTFSQCKNIICQEYGILTDFASRQNRDKEGNVFYSKVADKWADKKLIWMDPGPAYKELFSDSIEEMKNYNPIEYYTKDLGKMSDLDEDCICGQAWHPGFVDYYMCREGDKGPKARNFIECRPIDMHALCSKEIFDWLIDNDIELVSFTDALYDKQNFQNHLRNINSKLCVL